MIENRVEKMPRRVEPELLDNLPPDDPQAEGSRADIRRLNALMGHAGILTRSFQKHWGDPLPPARPLHIIELGGGDGTMLLRLAHRWSAVGVKAEVTLLDLKPVVSATTRAACAALGWPVQCLTTDVFAGLEQASGPVDVMLANLFLHHFEDERLCKLLELAAAKTRLFIACEPRRASLALAASRLLGCIGCNPVTRYDAVVSVRAGFTNRELSSLWPGSAGWHLSERPAGLFSHSFIARRQEVAERDVQGR